MEQNLVESTEFRTALVDWFKHQGRKLPWRETADPYAILVSELMLQQTQVRTVLSYYPRWFERFPTIRDLANAREAEVLHAWQGLGYYNRARNLHRCAKIIVTELNGHLPSSVDDLVKLPGIGRYTAGAIVCFAFDQPAPIVDGNIARAVSRLLNLQEPVDQPRGSRIIWDSAFRYVQGNNNPRLLNSALMELGAMICLPRKPLCFLCPVRSFCRARDPDSLPKKRERPRMERKNEFHFFALKDGSVLLEQNPGKRWQGLWTLPALPPDSGSARSADARIAFLSLSYPITRFVVRLNVFLSDPPATLLDGQAWHRLELLDCLPMPSPHRRAVQMALQKGGLISS
jgi:A/G-specific adenine glycosylase